MSAKQRALRVLPSSVVQRLDRLAFALRRNRVRWVQAFFGLFGFNVVRRRTTTRRCPC
jgi:hypothetical protein